MLTNLNVIKIMEKYNILKILPHYLFKPDIRVVARLVRTQWWSQFRFIQIHGNYL